MLVESCHCYHDFDYINSYGGRLELRFSFHLAVLNRHILRTIQAKRKNGQYIWVSETLTGWLDQSLKLLQPSLLHFFSFLRNITLEDMEDQLPWRNNESTSEKFWGRSLSVIFAHLTRFSTLESSSFVGTVRCVIVILSSVHRRLTTSKTFTCTRLSSPIALCAKHWQVVWRREYIVVAMERLLAIIPEMILVTQRDEMERWEVGKYQEDRAVGTSDGVFSNIQFICPTTIVIPKIIHTIYLSTVKHLRDWVTFFLEQHSRINIFNQLWAMMPLHSGFV